MDTWIGFLDMIKALGKKPGLSSIYYSLAVPQPLPPEDAGMYVQPLEMVRLAPSASNKQPWRVIKHGDRWHFYLQRTPNYGRGSLVFNLLRLADLQRVDMGIALCHFEYTARELGLKGGWKQLDPQLETPLDGVTYVVSWA